MHEPSILEVLNDAQKAHRAGDFVNALTFYQHFFKHALDEDPYALYAVRLSHCLHGWAELASVFPGAKQALENQSQSSLDDYMQKRNPEAFHDYLSICRALSREQEALQTFINLHNEQPKSAKKLSKYVWNDLIEQNHWEVCSDLMEDPSQKIDELFAVFDEADRLKQVDPSFDNPEFETHIVDQLILDTQRTVRILSNTNRAAEIAPLQRQFFLAVEQRNHASLAKQVHAKASYLFLAH